MCLIYTLKCKIYTYVKLTSVKCTFESVKFLKILNLSVDFQLNV